MTLEKAIAALENLLVDDPHFEPERRREAVQLGIEAIKRLRQDRRYYPALKGELLPGETKD